MVNGIKWHKCSDEMPKKTGEYLIMCCPGHIQQVEYDKEYDMWNMPYPIAGVKYWAEPNYPEGFEGWC